MKDGLAACGVIEHSRVGIAMPVHCEPRDGFYDEPGRSRDIGHRAQVARGSLLSQVSAELVESGPAPLREVPLRQLGQVGSAASEELEGPPVVLDESVQCV